MCVGGGGGGGGGGAGGEGGGGVRAANQFYSHETSPLSPAAASDSIKSYL